LRRGDGETGRPGDFTGWRLVACFVLACALGAGAASDDDPILRAMRDELARSRAVKVVNLEPPYFISYALDDGDMFTAAAELGGLLSSRHERFRLPEIDVRVGDYRFDDSNYAGGGFFGGARYDLGRYPLENDYGVLRRFLWLSTDVSYKAAVETIARKRAALRNLATQEQIDDFAKAEPVRRILPIEHETVEENSWLARVRSLSAIFGEYPQIRDSNVEVQVTQSVHYYVNSEGTELRKPENLVLGRARAAAQAPDGMVVRDATSFHSLDLKRFAGDPELRRGITAVAESLKALVAAPVGEDYSGPIMFEGVGAAQLVAQVLGKNLALRRRPVADAGRGGFFSSSELEGRQGSRVMPEWMDVVDDPTQAEWRGRSLFGHYEVDREGVVAGPVVLVEKGVLKNFLLTRQPMRGFPASNGRARLPGSFGASAAGVSNLFVRVSETVPVPELRKKLIEMCRNRSKPYGIIVRKLDFPSSASINELRQVLSRGQSGGSASTVSLPVLIYRVYPDGREELIRGMRFGGLNVRSLKDIVAAGDDSTVFDFLDNPAPFAMMAAGGHVAETAVVAPSLLIDDIELHKIDADLPKLPVVPPPGS
jgi:TldD protein